MTSVGQSLFSPVREAAVEGVAGAPAVEFTFAPRSLEEAARVLDLASEQRLRVLVWGGGTHQGFGYRIDPDVVVATTRLNELVDWQPDDLTVVVGAGMKVSDLEATLADRGQTAVLPEQLDGATVGGVIAAGISGWRRLRYGPTRDRMLEVVLATGDGRVVRGGGRVVKNVTGYDLPRLATGSFGSLGLIGQVCLKLWPRPVATATVEVEDLGRVREVVHRPLAVVEEKNRTRAYLAGQQAEVEAQVSQLGGLGSPGLEWPDPLDEEMELSVRVPPRLLQTVIGRLPPTWSYQAEHGVGQLRVGCSVDATGEADRIRSWSESVGGALVVARAPHDIYSTFDPWGSPPASLELQRRVAASFDPLGIVNPGRLLGFPG